MTGKLSHPVIFHYKKQTLLVALCQFVFEV